MNSDEQFEQLKKNVNTDEGWSGVIVGGSLSDGLEVRLAGGSSIEDVKVDLLLLKANHISFLDRYLMLSWNHQTGTLALIQKRFLKE